MAARSPQRSSTWCSSSCCWTCWGSHWFYLYCLPFWTIMHKQGFVFLRNNIFWAFRSPQMHIWNNCINSLFFGADNNNITLRGKRRSCLQTENPKCVLHVFYGLHGVVSLHKANWKGRLFGIMWFANCRVWLDLQRWAVLVVGGGSASWLMLNRPLCLVFIMSPCDVMFFSFR